MICPRIRGVTHEIALVPVRAQAVLRWKYVVDAGGGASTWRFNHFDQGCFRCTFLKTPLI